MGWTPPRNRSTTVVAPVLNVSCSVLSLSMILSMLWISSSRPLHAVDGAVFASPPANLFQTFYRSASGTISPGFPATPSDEPCASIAVNQGATGMNTTGWDAVFVNVPDAFANTDAGGNATRVNQGFFCAGFAEGFVTGERIAQVFANLELADAWDDASTETQRWIENHTAWMTLQVQQQLNDPVWVEVGHVLQQIAGLHAGYTLWANSSASSWPPLLLRDIFLINFVFEFYDVSAAMEALFPSSTTATSSLAATRSKKYHRVFGSHCSALVKLTEARDLIVSHNTWSTFESMLRQFKTYTFGSSYAVSFSSYPGTVHSGDDFYVTGNDFVILETTNENNNVAATAPFVDPFSVSEFIRVLVANRLSANGSQWASLFCEHNSGTYNNQWMVVDMASFMLNGQTVGNNTLWVVEQMPNGCVYADQSATLRNASYWASYNRPVYQQVFEGLGFAAMESQFGSLFSHASCYRAEIFRRNQSMVTDVDSMSALMRYNDYKHDVFSLVPNCSGAGHGGVCSPPYSPYLSVACRADLVPATADYGVLQQFIGQFDTAAIDAKVISFAMLQQPVVQGPWIISSPTYGGASSIPPFQFSTSPYRDAVHLGIPDVMNFTWVYAADTFNGAAPPPPAGAAAVAAAAGGIQVAFLSSNYSSDAFVDGLFDVFAAVYSQRGVMEPPVTRNAFRSMISIAKAVRGGPSITTVDFDVVAPSVSAQQPQSTQSRTPLATQRLGGATLSAVEAVTSALLWAPAATLTAYGFSDLGVIVSPPSALPESKPVVAWAIGVSIAAAALAAVVVVGVRRRWCTERADYDDIGEAPMNPREL